LGYAVCEPGAGESEVNGQQVDGLLLSVNSQEYYYTYAAALAFYSGTDQAPNGCSQAEALHLELLAQFPGDPIVSGIVDENREICSSVGPLGIDPTPERP
jgi:hypothetical protein